MALQSVLFRGDPKLDAAAVSDPAHIFQGANGPHVAKIQQALVQLDGAAISQDGAYGQGTAAAVSAFKQKRQILNSQGKIDNIVGKKTMAALDSEMVAKEREGGGSAGGGVRQGINTVGGATSPVILGRPLDIFVQFEGALGASEGSRNTAAENQFRNRTNTPAYLATHVPVKPIIFAGGRGANDQSAAAAGEVLLLRAVSPNGVTVVLGESSGGLPALKAAVLLTGLLIKLDYVAISDGAFFDRDGELITANPLNIRVPGTIDRAAKKDNFFQTFGHEILTNSNGPSGFEFGTEFHGPLGNGFNDVDVVTPGSAVANLKADFDRNPRINRILPGFLRKRLFSDPAHVAASRAGEAEADRVVRTLIKP